METINDLLTRSIKSIYDQDSLIFHSHIKLEELLHETINEETEELRNQLLQKDSKHKIDIKMTKHNTLIKAFRTKNVFILEKLRKANI